jgi:hypothetical protein
MGTAATTPAATPITDPFELLQQQFERYVDIVELGRVSSPSSNVEYWAPAPAPLTINTQR